MTEESSIIKIVGFDFISNQDSPSKFILRYIDSGSILPDHIRELKFRDYPMEILLNLANHTYLSGIIGKCYRLVIKEFEGGSRNFHFEDPFRESKDGCLYHYQFSAED